MNDGIKIVELNEEKSNNKNKPNKTVGVRHSDDDVKKAVVEPMLKMEQLNGIPEKFVQEHSECSRSSVGRICGCAFDSIDTTPNWTTIFIYSNCIIEESTNIIDFPKVVYAMVGNIVKDCAEVECTADDKHCVHVKIQFGEDKILTEEELEKANNEAERKKEQDRNE